jgi:arginase
VATDLNSGNDIVFQRGDTGTAVRGGLTFREGNYVCEALYATGKLRSMELVEVNPSLHSDMDSKQTIEMAMTLLASTMGQTIL